jgi:hypothetical protein
MDNDLVPRRRLALFGAAMFSLTAIVSLALFVAASKDKDPATLVIDGTVSGQLGQGSSPGGPDSLPSSSTLETTPSSIPSDLTPIDVVTTQPSPQPSTTKPSTVTTIQAPPPSKAPPTTKPPTTTTKPPTTPTSGLPINPPTPTGATLVEDDWGSPGSFKMIWEVSKATFSASREPVLDYVRSKGCTITEPNIGVFSCGNGVTGYASVGSREASAPDKVILHYSVTW